MLVLTAVVAILLSFVRLLPHAYQLPTAVPLGVIVLISFLSGRRVTASPTIAFLVALAPGFLLVGIYSVLAPSVASGIADITFACRLLTFCLFVAANVASIHVMLIGRPTVGGISLMVTTCYGSFLIFVR